MRFAAIIFGVSLLSFGQAQLIDIKELLGDEPLTPRRIVEDLLQYFQQSDPHGIPVVTIPEPTELEGPFTLTNLVLSNVSISGHSQIRLEYVKVNVTNLLLEVRLSIPRLEVTAQYEYSAGWLFNEGLLNLTFVALDIKFGGQLGVDSEGILLVDQLEFELNRDELLSEMTGLPEIISYVSSTIFDNVILPIVSSQVRSKGRDAVNERLSNITSKYEFPLDILPVDFAVAQIMLRKKEEIEPFKIKRKDIDLGSVPASLLLENIELHGLSTIHRTHEISTEIIDNAIYLKVQVGTQALRAVTDWSLYTSVFNLASGRAEFALDSFQIMIEVKQNCNVRHPPILRQIDLEIGNWGLILPEDKNLHYILEALVNIFPNILRSSLVDQTLERVLKSRIQGEFNKIDLTRIINEKLAEYEVRQNL